MKIILWLKVYTTRGSVLEGRSVRKGETTGLKVFGLPFFVNSLWVRKLLDIRDPTHSIGGNI